MDCRLGLTILYSFNHCVIDSIENILFLFLFNLFFRVLTSPHFLAQKTSRIRKTLPSKGCMRRGLTERPLIPDRQENQDISSGVKKKAGTGISDRQAIDFLESSDSTDR